VSLLNKMVRYHFKDRYQSATEVALQPLAELYLPTQQAAPQPSLTATDCLLPKAWAGQYANSGNSPQRTCSHK